MPRIQYEFKDESPSADGKDLYRLIALSLLICCIEIGWDLKFFGKQVSDLLQKARVFFVSHMYIFSLFHLIFINFSDFFVFLSEIFFIKGKIKNGLRQLQSSVTGSTQVVIREYCNLNMNKF